LVNFSQLTRQRRHRVGKTFRPRGGGGDLGIALRKRRVVTQIAADQKQLPALFREEEAKLAALKKQGKEG
jgi:hypothetical protein